MSIASVGRAVYRVVKPIIDFLTFGWFRGREVQANKSITARQTPPPAPYGPRQTSIQSRQKSAVPKTYPKVNTPAPTEMFVNHKKTSSPPPPPPRVPESELGDIFDPFASVVSETRRSIPKTSPLRQPGAIHPRMTPKSTLPARPKLVSEQKAAKLWQQQAGQLSKWQPNQPRFNATLGKIKSGIPIPKKQWSLVHKTFEEQVKMFHSHFGKPLTNNELEQILLDCCFPFSHPKNTEHQVKRQALSREVLGYDFQVKHYKNTKYISLQSASRFVEYSHEFDFEGATRQVAESMEDKFRLNIHPFDLQRACPIILEVLTSEDSPFLQWMVCPSEAYDITKKDGQRFRFGGQFTLYSYPEHTHPDQRCTHENTAKVLQKINEELAKNGIRPGTGLATDIPVEGLPYCGYRHDKAKNSNRYEHRALLTPKRIQEYYQRPKYKNVCRFVREGN